MTPQQERAYIDVDLKEIDLVFAQSHIRMTLISNLTNMSVALGSAVIAVLATIASVNSLSAPLELFLVIPLPFFVLAFLVLREDILMALHDKYFYRLRHRLLVKLDLSEADPSLRFLPEIKKANIGLWFTCFSALRYGPPFIFVAPSLIWFAYKTTFTFTARGVINVGLLSLNIFLVAFLVAGLLYLGRAHAENKILMPDVQNPNAQDTKAQDPNAGDIG